MRPGQRRTTGRAWTPAEERVLRERWHLVGERTLREALRGRTWTAIQQRAYVLGLPRGIPQGYESIKRAAERTGFEQHSLGRILEWAKVRVRTCYGSSRGPRTQRRQFVDPSDVDDAVTLWMRAETVSEAARKRGVSPDALLKWLRQDGAIPDDGVKRVHRVLPEIVDRTVSSRTRPGTPPAAPIHLHATRVRNKAVRETAAAGDAPAKRTG